MPEVLKNFSPELEGLPALQLYRGITPHQIDQLIALTRFDEDIRRFDSDDDRFGNATIYRRWSEKGRTMYVLSDQPDGTLYGLFWIGEQTLPEDREWTEDFDHTYYQYTMATRLYGESRGRHLSTRFILEGTDDFMSINGITQTGVWAEVSAKNEKSVRKNLSAGYRIVSRPNAEGKIIMIRDYQAA